jgi:hypothetical protein
MQVISDMEAVSFSDFHHVVEMMRYCKTANQTLQILAKKSLSTYQLRMKTRIMYRAHLIQMFVEIYTADDHDGSAEKLIQNHMTDDAYNTSPILLSYKAILSCLKAICYTIEKRESNDDLNAVQILYDIIKCPLRFYDVVLFLNSTSTSTSMKKSSLTSGRASGNFVYIFISIFIFIFIFIFVFIYFLFFASV